MWFSYPKDDTWIPVEIDRVKEIQKLNKEGVIPADLGEAKEPESKPVKALDYENVVGQDSLTRLDERSRNKNRNKHKNKSANPENRQQNQQRQQQGKDAVKPSNKGVPIEANKTAEAAVAQPQGGGSSNNKRRNKNRHKNRGNNNKANSNNAPAAE